MRIQRRRIKDVLVSDLPQELMFEIFSFSTNEEIQFTIPLVCKEFNVMLECAIRGRIIKRYCELCNQDKEEYEDKEDHLERFGLKKIFDNQELEELFVCKGCRTRCERCWKWIRLYKYEEPCHACDKYICGDCGTKCVDCCEYRVCYDCFPDGLKNLMYQCPECS